MGKQFEKYIKKLPAHLKKQILPIVIQIKNLELNALDIKKMQGSDNIYRCRVGKIRIIFIEQEGFGDILKIETRGDIYK